MKISVVIPAFNEEKNIRRCLHALTLQTLPRESFEVILVDNGSTDTTVAAAMDFMSLLPLIIASRANVTISQVRNEGAALAKGEVLAFLDSDCMAPPEWLENGLSHAQTNTVWGAHYKIPMDATWVGRFWFTYQVPEKTGIVSFLPGGDIFIGRADFQRTDGFPQFLETSEDVEFCVRAKGKGMQVIAYPDTAVYHEGTPRSLGHFYRQNRWHGRHVVRAFLNSLPSLANLPLIALTFYVFLLFWSSLLLPFMAIPTHHYLLAVLPLCLLVLPAFILSLVKAMAVRRPGIVPPLFVLYLVYLLARAAALTHRST